MCVVVYKPTIKHGPMYNSEREKAEHFFRFIFCYCPGGKIIPLTNWFHVFKFSWLMLWVKPSNEQNFS